ncbi:SGNH hydrolase-type esterase domain-containing protein [Scleroderma citrinum]
MAANAQDVIMLFGDSLTQHSWGYGGLAQRLAVDYVRKLDVLNRGFSGYQTQWAIQVLEKAFAKQHEQRHVPKVELLTIWFGANDAAPPPSLQHVPREEYMQNLKYLVDMIRSPTSPYYSPHTRIILITPPPVNSHQRSDRVFDITKSYAEAAKETGSALQLPVADVWTAIWEASGKDEKALEKYLHDGLHLNAAGYEIVYNSVMSIIEEKYPEIHYDKLQMHLFAPDGRQ